MRGSGLERPQAIDIVYRDPLAVHGNQLRFGKIVKDARKRFGREVQARGDDLLRCGQRDGLLPRDVLGFASAMLDRKSVV